ncbi:hypothetical protein [Aurantiacibacter hainanensis]|uniref:hypothetical protein n=1 Tax=Aurantiacibacter hainanensis TaxID=3076114 RepID=UPI0030C663D2
MPKLEIPKISDNPAYRTEASKYTAIRTRKSEVAERISVLQDKLLAIMLDEDSEATEKRASQILQGNLDPIPEGEGVPALRSEINRLETEMKALGRACSKQRERLDEVISELSLEVAEQVGEQHKRAVFKVVEAVGALDKACRDAHELRAAVGELGYTIYLPVFRTPPARFPLQPHYRLDSFLADARKYCS